MADSGVQLFVLLTRIVSNSLLRLAVRKALFPSAPWHDTQLRQFLRARAIRESLCFFKLHGSRSWP